MSADIKNYAQELLKKRQPKPQAPAAPARKLQYQNLHKMHPQVAENLHNYLEQMKARFSNGNPGA